MTRGFDFLGYWFSPAGLGIARKTVERMVENMLRLYEQGAPHECIDAYFQRWSRWVKGVNSANLQTFVFSSCVLGCSAIKFFGRSLLEAARGHTAQFSHITGSL
ncbi:MAG: hypothetical protein F6K24_19235 [Okeania sp. SIO2D1]|nr:hypothetical protein [Okeania sp. SIO2D1]